MEDFILSALKKQHQNNSYRRLTVTDLFIDFSSNDFLGLSKNKELKSIILERIQKLGHSGSGGSRLLSGNSKQFEQLEGYLANLFQSQQTLVFNSGYNANLGLLSSVAKKGDTIIYDENSHSSCKDGARLSFATKFSFKHNDSHDLELKLSKSKGNIFVVIESVYSMDGDFAQIHEILDVCKKYSAKLIVDEAHSTALFGNGSGWCVEQNIQNELFARIFTFGKAVGSFGACIAGSNELKEYLINFSRPFIYTTALPSYNLIMIEESLKFIQEHHFLNQNLDINIQYFKSLIPTNSYSAIQPILISGNENVKEKAELLQTKGLDVRAVLSPTVKREEERLRVCVHSFNTKKELDLLSQTLKEVK